MSVSAELTTGEGDITADQEYLVPTFSNLKPSEELRLLRARIAELERQQSINWPTSSVNFNLLAQNENDVADTLHGQNDDIEPNNDKESTADQLEGMKQLKGEEVIAKMEEFQKQQQHNIDKSAKMEEFSTELRAKEELHQTNEKLKNTEESFDKKLEEQMDALQTKMEEYQNKQQQTIDALTEKLKVSIEQHSLKHQEQEKKQKEQQQNIVDLQKTIVVLREIGLIPLNRWDSAACHPNLALIGPKQLVVQRNGKNSVRSSVMAEKPMLENPYFEVKILKESYAIHIGLATKQMPLDACVGEHDGTYGYGNYGYFWGHTVEGCSNTAKRRSYIKGNPKFAKRNVIGCGVNLKNGQIIYTKDGKRLDTDGLVVNSVADLFPCITLFLSDDKIKANFGPDFKYKF